MKMNSSFNAVAMMIGFLCLMGGNKSYAQRYLTERKPDLVLSAVTVKRENVDQLNVIWSIKNAGDATVNAFDNLVSLNLESSNKPNRAGEVHSWVSRGNQIGLNTSKKELKAGESISGSCLVACSAADLVSLRVSLYVEQDNFIDQVKENNTLVTLLVGK